MLVLSPPGAPRLFLFRPINLQYLLAHAAPFGRTAGPLDILQNISPHLGL